MKSTYVIIAAIVVIAIIIGGVFAYISLSSPTTSSNNATPTPSPSPSSTASVTATPTTTPTVTPKPTHNGITDFDGNTYCYANANSITNPSANNNAGNP